LKINIDSFVKYALSICFLIGLILICFKGQILEHSLKTKAVLEKEERALRNAKEQVEIIRKSHKYLRENGCYTEGLTNITNPVSFEEFAVTYSPVLYICTNEDDKGVEWIAKRDIRLINVIFYDLQDNKLDVKQLKAYKKAKIQVRTAMHQLNGKAFEDYGISDSDIVTPELFGSPMSLAYSIEEIELFKKILGAN